MVTGASTADAAIILIDARTGVLPQTRRHSHIVALLGIEHIAVAINKMDLVEYSQHIFDTIVEEYLEVARQLGLDSVTFIPMSALHGVNVTTTAQSPTWYSGPSLLEWLESVETESGAGAADALVGAVSLRLPVQWVNRPSPDFRGYAGRIVAGNLQPGDAIRVLPGGHTTTVAEIVSINGPLDAAISGQSVMIRVADEIDIGRGDLICAASDPAEVADQFEASIVWMHDEPMLPGRRYVLQSGPTTAGVTIGAPKYRIDVNTWDHLAATTLELNEIGVCNLSLDRPIAFDPYERCRDTGGFIIIDRITRATVGAGMLHFALRRSHNIHWQSLRVDRQVRQARNGHQPAVVWFTGLSGAGKSTIADLVEAALHARGGHTYLLDGDNVRHGLNRDLGFTDADRVENIRRVVEVAKLMTDAGLIVLVSFISPFRAERAAARAAIDDGHFIEVHVDAPLDVAEARDPKGLYAKARAGELANFTGIDSPYEPPEQPEIYVDTTMLDPAAAAEMIVNWLDATGMLQPELS